MRRFTMACRIMFILLFVSQVVLAQRGYFNAPYTRYEANQGTLTNSSITSRSYAQPDLQSEASGQVCVSMTNAGSAVEWTINNEADGLVVRYSVPDGETGSVEVYINNVSQGTLTLSSYYSWEYLSTNGNPNNTNVSNHNPKMRFDEVRMKLPSKISGGGKLRLVRLSGNIHLDFVELELIPAAVTVSAGEVAYTGNGSNLQTFIDANGGKTIYLPAGVYNVNRELYFGVNNTTLKGAGMWYTQIHFTGTTGGQGGLRANAENVSFRGLYLTTVRNSRSASYKAINGVFTGGATISDIWTEHFECGAWIGQYNQGGPAYADNFTVSHCRFRNNFADGINLCKGTRNAVVEYCSFRNNGDDDMAIWPANGLECRNNTFRFNTSEHCWRAAGIAVYGGYNNKGHNLLIKDNLEVGIKVNNTFAGAGFNDNGMHEFYEIDIIGCGTFNDLFNSPVGAINLSCGNNAGTRVKNVKFSDINILDSKNDAIYIRRISGEGFYNVVFQNITINGTGREYPYNNVNNLNWGRGYGILFVGNPAGYGTYCNITYSNRGGNANVNVNNAQIGTFSWTHDCSAPTTTFMTSGTAFGICDNQVTLTATSTAPSGQSISYVEFFVNNQSIGQDNSAPYSRNWPTPVAGDHQFKAVAHYSGGSNSPSAIQYVNVAEGIYLTATAPVIDGTIDNIWLNYAPFSLDLLSQGSRSGPEDISATFRIMRNSTHLFILVDVVDDILRNDGNANWQRDAIELFIDMGNDKAGPYVANNDFQWSFVWNISTPQTGLTFAQTTKENNLGYIMEIRIPWSTLGGAPATNALMGFDLHVNDNDSGTRNAKIAWKDITDNAWQSTAVLGTLQIAGCTNPYVPLSTAQALVEGAPIIIYPNPFHTTGSLKINGGNTSYMLMNIRDTGGKSLYQETLSGEGPFSIGEDLPPGMYLLELSDENQSRTIKFIKF
ncbi:MAG: sugar-binding protein [Cytophagaceae bacterium]